MTPRLDSVERPHSVEPSLFVMRHVVGIVLAAGTSSRMGAENKLLLSLQGAPLVAHAVGSLTDAGLDAIVVVTGHERRDVEAAVRDRDVRCVHNADYATGMASSIVAGVAAVPEADGWLIHLGDVPCVQPDTVRRLLERFADAPAPSILFPTQGGRRGHPVLFDAAFGDALTQITGDTGARPVVCAHPEAVVEIPVDDPGIHRDVDTPERYRSLRTSGGGAT